MRRPMCVHDNSKRTLYSDGNNSTLCNYSTVTKAYRLAPREVIEILCLCVRHEDFVKTGKQLQNSFYPH